MALLHGTELNIAPDGTVDWDASFLADFDVCVASVHSHFDLGPGPADQATHRLREPHVNIIGQSS
jgi:DNA polymerase (family X)